MPKTAKSRRWEPWIRFGAAVLGLALAFAAATFSTVMREQGNVLGTALFASAALLMAGVVAIVTVPYLARRAVLERFVASFDYDVTREGVVYLILTLVIGIAALNTGNNLLFVIVSAMLSAIVVSGLVSASMLRSLDLDVALPGEVFAGSPFLARVSVHNRRRILPAFSVTVVGPRKKTHRQLRMTRSVLRFPAKADDGKEWLRWPDVDVRWHREAPPSWIFSQKVYFPFLPAGERATADVELRFERRGRYTQDTFGLATRFPFSFLVKTRRVTLARELIVYPAIEPTDEAMEILPLIAGEFESFVRGRGNDLYRIREYMPEDSARHVDWKATARTGSLKVREFTREDERKLRIVFDNPPEGALDSANYERGVALAASLAWHFANEGAEVSFAAPGEWPANIHSFLRYLALVAPAENHGDLTSFADERAFHLIVTAREHGTIPTELWAKAYVVFLRG